MMKKPKREPIIYQHIPQYGLAYSDGTRVKVLLMRNEGQLLHQGYLVQDHPHEGYVLVHRVPDGGVYTANHKSCTCPRRIYKDDCRHSEVLRSIGDIQAIKKGWAWWKSLIGEEEEKNK